MIALLVFLVVLGVPLTGAVLWVIATVRREDSEAYPEDTRDYEDSYYDDHWY